MGMMKITVNGRPAEAAAGASILQACLDAGIYLPHLCSHPCLPVHSTCKLCVVTVNGGAEPVCACSTPVEDGMSVETEGPQLDRIRRMALELMLAGHPHDCMGCRSYTNCELQSLLQYLGVTHARLRTVRRTTNRINTVNPLIDREMERCVQCGRCVRVCREVRGVGVLKYRKGETGECYIGTEGDRPLPETDCRFCSACVEICPTGALQDRRGTFRADLPRKERLIPCRAECPAQIDIPAYLRLIREGKYSQAVGVIREKVPFPHVLGYVCNHLCESGCKRQGLNSPVAIRDLKRFAVEHDTERIWEGAYLAKEPSTGKKIAVVGAGPCGLTAAYYLNRLGHQVVVFEQRDLPGGPLTSGIPEYRLPTKDALAEIALIERAGVRILCGHRIEDVAALKREYDCVLVAVGVSKGKKLGFLPGADFRQVYTAIDVLADVHAGKDVSYLGSTVCVIGGGAVGYDCARSLIRRGLAVNLACLEKGEAILAGEEDRREGAEEGILLYDGRSFEAIEGTPEQVTGLRVHSVVSSTYDKATGQVTEVAEAGSTMTIPCDSVVFATGQYTGLQEFENFGLQLTPQGYPVQTDHRTSLEGVFAAGDAITGISFVIRAIAQGREVAALMDRYLGGSGAIDGKLVEREEPGGEIGTIEGFAAMPRRQAAVRDAGVRKGDFQLVCQGLDCGQAACEAERCLQCDLRLQIPPEKLWSSYSVN